MPASIIHDCQREQHRGQVACSHCALSEICLPRGLSDKDTARFEQIVNRSHPLHANDYLFRAGDDFTHVAAVRSGCFKSYTIDYQGEEQVLGFHLPGEIIGLDAIHNGRHIANIMALDTSSVCSLTFTSVADMARHMPELQNEMFRIMSQRISELESIAGDLSADARIALFLISLSKRFARRGYSDKEFILAMSRRDIASFLRLATETVSRVLARFQKQNLIKVNRKQVQLLDIPQLEQIGGLASKH